MTINLNDPHEFSLENVSKLIASKDDSADRQLRVTLAGIAFLSDTVGGDDLDGILFRFETWSRDTGWAGPEAAADEKNVRRVYDALVANWPKPEFSYIDVY